MEYAFKKADIQAGRPAGYLVQRMDPASRLMSVVRDAQGRPLRYRWTQPPAEDPTAEFKAQRDRIFATGGVRIPAEPGYLGTLLGGPGVVTDVLSGGGQ